MKIGYRTIKTAVGTGLAVYLARELDLQFYTMAGVITMVGIQPTLRRSVMGSAARFIMAMLALLVGYLLFEVVGYSIPALILFLILYIPFTVRLKMLDGLVNGAVVVMHLFSFKKLTLPLFINEMLLFLIGISVALLSNLVMPNTKSRIRKLRRDIDDQYRRVLGQFAQQIREGSPSIHEPRFQRIEELLESAEEMAQWDWENRWIQQDISARSGMEIRREQLYGLKRMQGILGSLRQSVPQGEPIARLLRQMSDSEPRSGRAGRWLEELAVMYENPRQQELPVTREEFETRSALFQLLRELAYYLQQERKLEGLEADGAEEFKHPH